MSGHLCRLAVPSQLILVFLLNHASVLVTTKVIKSIP
jgi:hypothetical protein